MRFSRFASYRSPRLFKLSIAPYISAYVFCLTSFASFCLDSSFSGSYLAHAGVKLELGAPLWGTTRDDLHPME